MTYQAISSLYEALGSLSRPAQVLHNDALVQVQNRFSAATAIRIAQMRSILAPHIKAAEEARNTLLTPFGGQIKSEHPDFAKVVSDLGAMALTDVEVAALGKLDPKDFMKEGNTILPEVFEHILPHLDQ